MLPDEYVPSARVSHAVSPSSVSSRYAFFSSCFLSNEANSDRVRQSLKMDVYVRICSKICDEFDSFIFYHVLRGC